MRYRGRFAPSPTGLLHQGSLLCALATYLDARAHDGVWLLRIEDIDRFRDVPGAGEKIIETLKTFGMQSDEEVLWQSKRDDVYEDALCRLKNRIYPCTCSRHAIEAINLKLGLPLGHYPGTCRNGTKGTKPAALRFRTDDNPLSFTDRRLGKLTQNVEKEVGDFIVKRADGCWAYQLAVVVDDAAQKITHVVRGEDLFDNTPRQIALQKALGYPTPDYLHIPLLRGTDGAKLSKQTKAPEVTTDNPLTMLESLMPYLNLEKPRAKNIAAFYRVASNLWKEKYGD